MSIRILIADDNSDVCDSIEENIYSVLEKYEILKEEVEMRKIYTEHAYNHGKKCVEEGFKPDICIFDLTFNGDSAVDLYKFISNYLEGKLIHMCIYTGAEKKLDKRKEAENLASEGQGLITILPKPDISSVLSWIGSIIEREYGFKKKVTEEDPFDLL